MEERISLVTFVVTNQPRALEFYTEQVGFVKKTDITPPGGYRWVTAGPKGQDLELALWEVGLATDPDQREWSKQWAPAKSPAMVLRVADCTKIF